MRATRLVAVGLLTAAAGGCASGSKAGSSTEAARVRVVNDASQVQGCQVPGCQVPGCQVLRCRLPRCWRESRVRTSRSSA